MSCLTKARSVRNRMAMLQSVLDESRTKTKNFPASLAPVHLSISWKYSISGPRYLQVKRFRVIPIHWFMCSGRRCEKADHWIRKQLYFWAPVQVGTLPSRPRFFPSPSSTSTSREPTTILDPSLYKCQPVIMLSSALVGGNDWWEPIASGESWEHPHYLKTLQPVVLRIHLIDGYL
jgi:hypothetical protein